MRELLAATRPASWPGVFAVDASSWARCDAETSPERGYYHHPSRHSNGQPIVAGWNYSWIAQLNWEANSWTAPLDMRRIPPSEDAGQVTAGQVEALVGRLGADGAVPLFVFDAGYDPIALSVDLARVRAQILVRIRSDRVFFPDPAARPAGDAGATPPPRARFACADPASWPAPGAALSTTDARYGRVEVQAGAGSTPASSGAAAGPATTSRRSWPAASSGSRSSTCPADRPGDEDVVAWWAGPGTPDLDVCWRAYIRRFDIEHTLRFVKHTLGWTTPRVRLPEQADRWTWLVVAAYTQLRLARGLVYDCRLPWERPCDPARLTPTRVRRGFRRLVHILGTPARAPKPTKAGPGRPKGSRRGPAPRYPALKKAA